jgi:hypothetical protein
MNKEKDDESKMTATVTFRCEPECREICESFAGMFGQEESWGWRVLAMMALGKKAPEKYQKIIAKMNAWKGWEDK